MSQTYRWIPSLCMNNKFLMSIAQWVCTSECNFEDGWLQSVRWFYMWRVGDGGKLCMRRRRKRRDAYLHKRVIPPELPLKLKSFRKRPNVGWVKWVVKSRIKSDHEKTPISKFDPFLLLLLLENSHQNLWIKLSLTTVPSYHGLPCKRVDGRTVSTYDRIAFLRQGNA